MKTYKNMYLHLQYKKWSPESYKLLPLDNTCQILTKISLASFFSKYFVRLQVVQPYSSSDMAKAYMNSCFISLARSDFHMINNLSIKVYTLLQYMLLA